MTLQKDGVAIISAVVNDTPRRAIHGQLVHISKDALSDEKKAILDRYLIENEL